ncbi:MAG TPA: helix-turn-helix transcriptional regulator [Clostridia bacterium]|nr:helix-turn-helix transcriptional regulator [Clostridia bacterium]
MTLVEKIKHLCDKGGTTFAALERELGFGQGSIRKWDISSPAAEKLQKVADYFDVSTDYLLGRETEDADLRAKYGLPEGMNMEKLAEAMHKNPQLGVLFSRSAKMDDKAVDAVLRIIDVMNRDGEDGI